MDLMSTFLGPLCCHIWESFYTGFLNQNNPFHRRLDFQRDDAWRNSGIMELFKLVSLVVGITVKGQKSNEPEALEKILFF